jgi:transposase
VFIERTSVGLDVHARSVVAAAIDGVTGEVFRARLTPGNDVVGGCRTFTDVRPVPHLQTIG